MRLLTVGAFACAIMTPGPSSRTWPSGEGQVDLKPEGPIRDWIILGPFENPRELGTRDRKSFDTDYLTSIGGEANARISEDTEVATAGADGQPVRLAAKPVALAGNVLDFVQQYTETEFKLAYAYTEISATRDGEALFLLGSDDGAKVWVNGALVFDILPPGGRGLTARQDRFTARLRKGANRVLVKVENGRGAWQLALEAYGTEAARKLEAQMELERRTLEFQDQGLAPAGAWPAYVFRVSGGFPRIIWRDADRVRELAGDLPLRVRWFNAELDEVETPTRPGRYAAVVESKMRDGTPLKRAMTFFAMPDDTGLFWPDYRVEAPFPGAPIDPEVWKEHEDAISEWCGGLWGQALVASEGGAKLLAWLYDMKPGRAPVSPMESPGVVDQNFHLRLKLKLAGLTDAVRPLAPPVTRPEGAAPMLHVGTADEAGVKPDAKERIDAACRKWAEDSGEPFTVLVARNGVIVTHEAFGELSNGIPLPLSFRYEVASITKALTGMLFSRFVDQGLISIDDPVGKCLPGFPVKGSQALTFRHLFTHTSGLQGHGNWGGIDNPYLENVILNGLPALHPGETHIYNGMGYDLAGKAMEMITGKSITRLMYDDLFLPLGLKDVPPVADLGFGARLTAYELGVLAQWLANRGSYGDRQFVSEATFQSLLPEPLSKYWPEIGVEWGIGLTPYTERREGAPPISKDPADLLLGEQVVGHGSATSCVLRVALDKHLVVVMIRRTAGDRYDEHLREVLMAVTDSLL